MPSTPHLAAPSRATPTQFERMAFWAAAAASAGVLASLVAVVARPMGPTPGPALAWLLASCAGGCAVGVGWSLWRQRELESALRTARAEAAGLVALCDGWTWEADAAGRVIRWRPPSAAAPSAAPLDKTVGQPLWEIFSADPTAAAALRLRLDGGLPLRGQKASVRFDDAVSRFELSGLSLSEGSAGDTRRWIGTARNTDEDECRAHAQRAWQVMLGSLPVPVFELAGDGTGPVRVTRATDAAVQWLGIKPADAAGMEVVDLLARLPQDLRSTVAHALAEPRSGADLPRCAGWEVLLRPFEEGEAGTRHWLLTLMPIARADAPPADANAESESFSYTVSHDLRAPIRVVEGFTKILKEDYGRQLDRIGNDHLDRVLGAAARMNAMIDALLALAQLSSRPLARQPVNLSQLAAYVVEDLRRQAPERSVQVHVEGGLLVQGDPTLLRVVLENLLGNAWKYSARARNAQIWLERGQHERQDVFTVRDNGAGFDMRFADRLFGVFQRLHSASDFPGTGVGLASVRRIIQRHGGEVWAESEVDRGSSFHFSVPAQGKAA